MQNELNKYLETVNNHAKKRQFAEALGVLEKAMALAPFHPDLWFQKANLLQELKRLPEAVACYQGVIRLNPANPFNFHNLALALEKLGRFDEALLHYDNALSLKADYAEAYANKANSLQKKGEYAQALQCYDTAITLGNNNELFYRKKGELLHHLNQVDAALLCYDKALTFPSVWKFAVYNNKAVILENKGRLEEALLCCDAAIALKPGLAEAYNNKGNNLRKLGRFEDAWNHYQHGLTLKPAYPEIYNNMGYLLQEQGKYSEAITHFKKAIRLAPAYAEAHFNLSLNLLKQGDYAKGWQAYEWRWKRVGMKIRSFPAPLWLGKEAITGKTILLHAEQGLGDTLQFCRYAPLLADKGVNIILEVHPPLVRLLQSLDERIKVFGKGEALPAFDFHIPLMSLPLALGTTLDTIPATVAYLKPDAANLATWQLRLGAKTKKRIGLVWSGAAVHSNDHNRSLALNSLAPLLSGDFEFHALQKEIREKDEAFLRTTSIISHSEDLQDFLDTASLVQEMDIIISVDTSVAHLAGALGKTVYLMLPFNPDFRWLLERSDSPWYPSLKLFRQPAIGDWEGVVNHIGLHCLAK